MENISGLIKAEGTGKANEKIEVSVLSSWVRACHLMSTLL